VDACGAHAARRALASQRRRLAARGMCVRSAAALRPPAARRRGRTAQTRRLAPARCAARSSDGGAATHARAHAASTFAALALLLAPAHAALAAALDQEMLIENVPSALSAGDSAPLGGESRSSKLRGANSKAISNCASACITTCTRGCVALRMRREP
jgi:hypothetical protein